MTITFLQPDGVQITAQAARQGSAAIYGGGAGRPLGGRSGFRVDTPSNVLTVTSTTWTLAPCAAMIDPGFATAQGMYGWASDANVSGSITASDATNTRMDIVYIQVNDSSAGDGSGAKSANVSYLAGTPSATPVAPALPVRSFLVGTITVPKTGGGSPTVALNPARFVTAGGVLPVLSAADRANIAAPYVGMEIQRLDLTAVSPGGVRERWNGTSWDHFGHAEFTTATNTAPTGAAWGMGVFSADSANTTDPAFVTINATDVLKVRDAGVYSVTVLLSFTTTISGISWLATDGSYTTTLGGGLQVFTATLPNWKLTAGATIKPLVSHGSGADRSFTSRVRITRIQ